MNTTRTRDRDVILGVAVQRNSVKHEKDRGNTGKKWETRKTEEESFGNVISPAVVAEIQR